jgi:hypothetical protein
MTPLINEIKGRVIFGGIISMFGLPEALYPTTKAPALAENVKNLVQLMRYHLTEYYLPYFIGQYEDGATGRYSPESLGAQIAISQIDSIPSILPNAVVIPSEGCAMNDDHHYNYEGYQTWTQRIIDSIEARGWGPPYWGTAISGKGFKAIHEKGPQIKVSPNPFLSKTDIFLNLSGSGRVNLSIYNLSGRRVKTIMDASLKKGHHRFSWMGINETGGKVTPGTYLINVRVNDKNQCAQKTVIIK